ncbi:MAG: hypothetical protein M1812_007510 [Candelaria pacifica]|nr:MAG: hypothetical protein M1812_007510 [Candelaria pacifica]
MSAEFESGVLGKEWGFDDNMDSEFEAGESGQLVPCILSPSLAESLVRDRQATIRAEWEASEERSQEIRVMLSPSLVEEIQKGGEGFGNEGSDTSGESITIYFDSTSRKEVENKEQIDLQGLALDTTILEKIRNHENLDECESESAALFAARIDAASYLQDVDGPLARLVDELVASRKLFVARNTRYVEFEDSLGVLPHDVVPELLMHYVVWLLQVQEHNRDCLEVPRVSHVLSDSLLTKLWVEEQLHSRWTQKYRTSLAAERAQLKARRVRAEMMGDQDEMRTVARERRVLDRTIFAECAHEQLEDINDTLEQDLIKPLVEIEELQLIQEGQQATILGRHFTLLELVENMEDCQSAVITSMQEEMENIEVRLNAMDDLLDFAEARTKRIKTRLNRLDAKDVRDYQERMNVRRERMDRPEACEYVADTCQDILSIQEIARVTGKCSEEVSSGTTALAAAVLDLHISMKDCTVFGEMAERS